ncbi:hypothetical protein BH09VER1_BH09VER1_53730 [soil metagenome]
MIEPAAGALKEVLVDSGFLSEAAVTEIRKNRPGTRAGRS